MIVFISGKITGDPTYRSKFADAETVLSNLGHAVLNPTIIPDGVDYETCMKICFSMIDAADMVVFLPDYRDSKGSTRERVYAGKNGKKIRQYETFVKQEIEREEQT